MPKHDINIKKYQCVPCEVCEGSGLFSISDIDGKDVTYVPCEICLGYQCFLADKNTLIEIYCDSCDEHCGHNRESLKENWSKM
jgi:hypothetical protein